LEWDGIDAHPAPPSSTVNRYDPANRTPRTLEFVGLGDQRQNRGRDAQRVDFKRRRHFPIHFHPIGETVGMETAA